MRCARSVLLALLLLLGLVPAASAHEGSAPDHRDTAAELAGADINRALTLSRLAGTPSADLPQYLPTTWCGSERTTDDTTNAAYSSALRQIKVVYAYANDMTDRFSAWRDAIQADVSRIDQYLALQTGGRRALRFDMGTSCGPQYLDVQVVHLPQNASVYTNDPSEFNELAGDVATAVGVAAGRDVFVIGDELAKPADGVWGIAEVGNGSASNGGTLTAIMWTPPGTTPSASGWQPTVMLHEITHNLGGVPTNTPNATSFSHCTDGEDVMCYPDGSPEAANYNSTVCPTAGGDIPQTYDCGHDDYFNPDPAPGNWLADPSHWNVYNSSFFGPCSQLGKACGDNVVPSPPVNTTLPSIAGAAQRGVALTATVGTWLNQPTSYAIQWQRSAGSDWLSILGATGSQYVPTTADVGAALRVVVTATNVDGSAIVASAPTNAVVGDYAPPAAAPTPGKKLVTVRIALRDRRHRTAGTVAAIVRAIPEGREIRTQAVRVALPAGKWRLKLCGGPKHRALRCALGKRVRSRKRGVTLPATRLIVRGSSGALRIIAGAVDGRQRVRAQGQTATA